EFFTPSVSGLFTTPKQNIRVSVGFFLSLFGSETAELTLRAFDANHQVVAQSAALVTSGRGFHTPLQVSAASSVIASFQVTARASLDVNKALAIDSVTFDAAPDQDDDG